MAVRDARVQPCAESGGAAGGSDQPVRPDLPTSAQHPAVALVLSLGLADPARIRGVRPLAGGVSSDIFEVDLGHRRVCAKFALERLRVGADWRAPVDRNRVEHDWLAMAASVLPDHVPRLLGRSEPLGGFVMEMIDGPGVTGWKAALMAGAGTSGEGAAVGAALARLHAATARPDFDVVPFRTAKLFEALRIEPFLTWTAQRVAEAAPALLALAEHHRSARLAVIHGDMSPKNILFRDDRPMFLDAECATVGDPAFDLAFCLTHLMLKTLHMPVRADAILGEAHGLHRAHAEGIDWEPAEALEARTAALLPALMLARVRGKSPVEYLPAVEQRLVVALVLPLLARPPSRLADIFDEVRRAAADVRGGRS